jgi:VWFA-related protein
MPIWYHSALLKSSIRGEAVVRTVVVATVMAMLAAITLVPAQESGSGSEETILIDLLALDDDGRTLTELSPDQLQLTIDLEIQNIDSLELGCPDGALDEIAEIEGEWTRAAAPDLPRKIVFLFDYIHLSQRDRNRVLNYAQKMVEKGKTPQEEILVAAISHSLRIEQRFTADAAKAVEAMERMQFDNSLFAVDHRATGGQVFFDALSTLMDVLAQYEGTKAVVLFSAAQSRGDVFRIWFDDVAQRAAPARVAIYPAYTSWLERPVPASSGLYRLERKEGAQGVRILSKLAMDTGGRIPPRGAKDLSLSYARAQRDLSCRFTLGYRTTAENAARPHTILIRPLIPKVDVHFPREHRVWSEKDLAASRMRAAYAYPARFEHPLVRTTVMPFRPTDRKAWDVFVANHLPMPVGPDGAELEIGATVTRIGDAKPEEFRRKFEVPTDPSGVQPVTVYADAKLKSGWHTLTVVLTSPDVEGAIVSTESKFEVPEAPKRETFVLGPLIARVVKQGVLIRADDEPTADTAVDRILKDGESFEPLAVYDVSADERLILGWSICSSEKRVPTASIERKFVAEDGTLSLALDDVDLATEGSGSVRCHVLLDPIDAGALEPGDHEVKISVVATGSGKVLATASAPLQIH